MELNFQQFININNPTGVELEDFIQLFSISSMKEDYNPKRISEVSFSINTIDKHQYDFVIEVLDKSYGKMLSFNYRVKDFLIEFHKTFIVGIKREYGFTPNRNIDIIVSLCPNIVNVRRDNRNSSLEELCSVLYNDYVDKFFKEGMK